MPDLKRLTTELLVIGGGAAGMAAAYSAASRGIDVILCDERHELGGILPQCIHKGFGLGRYGKDLTGPEYCSIEKDLFLSSAVRYYPDTYVMSLSPDRTASASGPQGMFAISFEECILAAGCREKPLWSLPVAGTRPQGIYTAGEAQEAVNLNHQDIGSRIFILGSGDIGMIMARRFTLLGKTVVGISEIRDRLGGLKRNQDSCVLAYDIPVYLRTTVTEVHGYPSLTSVTLRHLNTGRDEIIECDTLITSLGLIPERSLAEPLRTPGGWPEWLHFCGNADTVHEIVDAVSTEGERLGNEIAARFRDK